VIAGHCTACNALTWKTVTHPATGDRLLLWPRPSSRYPIFEDALGHAVRGVGYCGACCPEVGAEGPETLTASIWDQDSGQRVATLPIRIGACVAVETARERYRYWFTPRHGDFLRAWLRDHVDLDKVRVGLIEDTMAEWEQDRVA
jgi:hypothetical protein